MTGCCTWSLFILFPTALSKGIEAGFPSRLSQLQPEFFPMLWVFCACRDWYPALLMETKSGWMSQKCKTSSAILAAAPPLPDPRPKVLTWNQIMALHLCGQIWLVAIPCGTGLAVSIPKGMRSSVQSENPFLELMIPQSLTLVIWGWLAVQPLSTLTFLTQLAGSGRTSDHFAFHLALAHLK